MLNILNSPVTSRSTEIVHRPVTISLNYKVSSVKLCDAKRTLYDGAQINFAVRDLKVSSIVFGLQ